VVPVSNGPAAVSVIIPTLARPERVPSLMRAIDSITSQAGGCAVPIVVVNGPFAAPAATESLAHRQDLRLITLADASLPLALHAGRAAVETAYFSVLDDDDELLPEAVAIRLGAFEADPRADVVVTNGYLDGFGRREINIADFHEIEREPLRTLLRRNWLSPCAGTFRTRAVPLELFERIPAYREWTYLGLRLALDRTIRFLNRPTFVYRTDTDGSLSKSKAYILGEPRAIAEMLRLDLPSDVRAMVRDHLRAGLHSASDRERVDGNYVAAWGWHLRCLAQAGGWRYLSYTRHLLSGSARRMAAALRLLGDLS